MHKTNNDHKYVITYIPLNTFHHPPSHIPPFSNVHDMFQPIPDLMYVFHFSGPPSVLTISCVNLSEDMSGAVTVTVNWTLNGGDSADFYLITITTTAPQTPYGGLLNITASVTQYELTGFQADYEYNITVRGVNCGNQEGDESEPLTITPQGTVCAIKLVVYVLVLFKISKK